MLFLEAGFQIRKRNISNREPIKQVSHRVVHYLSKSTSFDVNWD